MSRWRSPPRPLPSFPLPWVGGLRQEVKQPSRFIALPCTLTLDTPTFFVFTRAKPLQSCPTLCHLMDHSSPGSSVHEILTARILEQVAMPSSRVSSWPRDWTHVSCNGRWILYHCAWWSQSVLCSMQHSSFRQPKLSFNSPPVQFWSRDNRYPCPLKNKVLNQNPRLKKWSPRFTLNIKHP